MDPRYFLGTIGQGQSACSTAEFHVFFVKIQSFLVGSSNVLISFPCLLVTQSHPTICASHVLIFFVEHMFSKAIVAYPSRWRRFGHCKESIRFTQCKMEYNMGWLVQAGSCTVVPFSDVCWFIIPTLRYEGVPQNGWFRREHPPICLRMIWESPYFRKPPYIFSKP